VSEPLVIFKNVIKCFGDFVAVHRLNLLIQPGEFIAIMGPSGCGKTTTLRMLAGLEQPTEGEIWISGKRMNEVSPSERDTPMVWQSLALFPFLNVLKNVEFGLKMRGADPSSRRQRSMEWLERLGIAEFAERDVTLLSGGQRQRVALARALVTEPQILLLDEPLSALDANLVIHMQGVLTRLQKELGITFVYVTHSQSEAFAMADRVVIMNEGSILQVGTPQSVYRNPTNRFVAEFVGTNNIISGTVKSVISEVVHLETKIGTFKVKSSSEQQVVKDSKYSFVISADHVLLSSKTETLENCIPCSLISEEFVGSVVTLYFEDESGTQFRVQKQQRDLDSLNLKIGETIWASWETRHAYLLPEET
jgi:spermidine/putrescine transport system ATP-binding protein|tara:strand:+ start:4734 stop:5825 length:1092 start_codon:yes stop_codon:yes gene_type:complete